MGSKLEGWAAFENARPNAVHKAVVKLERSDKIECVVTQNIDGLHTRAGTSPERLIELHGTNAEVECQTCGKRSDPERHYAAFRRTKKPPLCECGGYLKSATISFGQLLIEADLHRQQKQQPMLTWRSPWVLRYPSILPQPFTAGSRTRCSLCYYQ